MSDYAEQRRARLADILSDSVRRMPLITATVDCRTSDTTDMIRTLAIQSRR